MEQFEFYRPEPEPRHCSVCGSKLSRYNSGEACFAHRIEEVVPRNPLMKDCGVQPRKKRTPDSVIYAVLDEPNEITTRALAFKYGVSLSCIWAIRNGDLVPLKRRKSKAA